MSWGEEKPTDLEFDRLSAEKSSAIEHLNAIVKRPDCRRTEIATSAAAVPARVLHLVRKAFFAVLVGCAVAAFVDAMILALAVAVSYLVIHAGAMFWRKRRVEAALRADLQELRRLEYFARQASARIGDVAAEYDTRMRLHCETFPSYPGDWERRRRLVLERDHHTCTACGWPRGYRRRARELHVHHVVSLSDGGTNRLSNLTTLCHPCHREVDSKHAGVRKQSRMRRRRRR